MADSETIAATFLLPSGSTQPLVIELPHHALRLVVVTNGSVGLLDESWDASGVYVLLGHGASPDDYSAYVGKAPSGLRGRVREHVRSREGWVRALLVAHTSYGFSSAAVGWLEGALWDVLDRAPAAHLRNRNRPRDETLPPWERRELERYLAPITAVLRAVGASPDTPDQLRPARSGSPRRYTETVGQLLDAGLLKIGTRLRPLPEAYDTPASVLAEGRLQVQGAEFNTPSAAATHVCGHNANGWNFWGAPSGDGTLVSLSSLRRRLRAVGGSAQQEDEVDPGLVAREPPGRPGATDAARTAPGTTLRDLVDAGLLRDRTIVASYKQGTYEAGVLDDGGIRMADGRVFRSPSQAALQITGSPTNGWVFWKARTDEGLVRLTDLRARLRSGGPADQTPTTASARPQSP